MSDCDKQLQRLYKKIPAFECKKDCADCCGIIPWSVPEQKKVAGSPLNWSELFPGTLTPIGGIDCPFSGKGLCDVYENRPLVCRLFGAVESKRMICPHGCGPSKKLTERQGKKIMSQYKVIVGKNKQ